jgi:hypothetical protein
MQIDLRTLSQDIIDQLPLSIQLLTIIEVNDLPISLQYIILNNKVSQVTNQLYNPTNIVDADFVVSPYNDFTIRNTKRSAIIDYIRNYLLTPKGSYPFDPEFGNTLKKHLQTRDSSLRETLLGAELRRIVNVIQTSFSIAVSILGSQLTPINVLDRIEYQLDIKFSIDNTVVNFSVG